MNAGNSANEITGLIKLLQSCWADYGRWHAFVRSPFFYLSLLMLLSTFSVWSQPKWWELPLQVLPGLIGFTIGGYAISASIGDDKFKKIMAGEGQDGSLIRSLSATFTHFIIVEVFAVFAAIVGRAALFTSAAKLIPALGDFWLFENPQRHWVTLAVWAFGFWLFLYGLSSALAITISLFRVTQSFDKFHKGEESDKI